MTEQEYQQMDDEEIATAYMKNLIAQLDELKNQDVIKFQLDLHDTIIRILMNVGGYLYDDDSKKLLRRKKPLMNSTGFLRVAEMLSHYLNKNTVLSYLSKGDIHRMMKHFIVEFYTECYHKMEDYAIDPDTLSLTVDSIANDIFITLKRAHDGRTHDSIQEYLKVQETLKQYQEEQKQGSIFDR